MTLVEIAPPGHDVDLAIAYATAGNFTGAPVYRRAACYLHADAVPRLERAVALARAIELRLRIFDGFRPAEAQWRLWSHYPDPDFVADPHTGSRHSRGIALDLTLADASGVPLEMGSPFDEFSTRSHHNNTDIPAAAQRNRYLLLGIMLSAGWELYPFEWWHYQLPDESRYPLLSDSVLPDPLVAA